MFLNDDLKQALEVLRQGGVILYPTDTIWGIGCDATNPEAVKRIFGIKQREDVKSMLVLIGNPNMLNSYVREVPEVAWQFDPKDWFLVKISRLLELIITPCRGTSICPLLLSRLPSWGSLQRSGYSPKWSRPLRPGMRRI